MAGLTTPSNTGNKNSPESLICNGDEFFWKQDNGSYISKSDLMNKTGQTQEIIASQKVGQTNVRQIQK